MDRRKTLKLLGTAAFGAILPALAFQPTDKVPILGSASEVVNETLSATPKVTCRIIGVGDAGINVAVAAFSSGVLHTADCQPEFACVSMGQMGIRAVINANRLHPGIAPIRPIQLGRYGAGGNVNVARAAAKKYDGTLRSLVEGAEIVILTAGLGGGTGSGVAPILGSIAQEAGALVLGVVVTPFNWELGRYPNAFQAVKALEGHSHYLVSLPNEKMAEFLGMDATLDEVIAHQEALATACIHRLLLDGHSYCIESRHRSA